MSGPFRILGLLGLFIRVITSRYFITFAHTSREKRVMEGVEVVEVVEAVAVNKGGV